METSGKSKEVHQFCDESADEISDEDSEKKLREGPLHSATIRIKLNDMNSAEMIRRALAVDKEPKRSKAVRTLSVDGTTLIAYYGGYLLGLMFKGLKSKLEGEAKRLQATVSQYGESLTQQIQGSSVTSSPFLTPEKDEEKTSGNPSVLVDLYDETEGARKPRHSESTSAIMQEVEDIDLEVPPRERRDSLDSSASHESSLSSFFSSIPGLLGSPGSLLDTVNSDSESASIAGSSVVGNASKEQISSILQKLQGRATNYKDKYRDVVRRYNEVVRENEKCRNIMATTQDKAIQKIKKLKSEKAELVIRLKKSDEVLKKTVDELDAQNQREREQAVQRVIAEWKGRVDGLEADWTKRLQQSEERATLAIAKVKAEVHATLEEKDNEVQAVRCKLKEMDVSERALQAEAKELRSTIEALENEKADMVEKLSQAKQQGVKAVRDEEEARRKELLAEMEEKRRQDRLDDEKKLKEELKKMEDHWRARFEEQKEQTQLAIEEREMQKAAAVMEHDRKNDDLGAQVEHLTAEKLQLVTALDEVKSAHQKQIYELEENIDTMRARHKEEISNLIKEHDEILDSARKDYEVATNLTQNLKAQIAEMQKKFAKKSKEYEEEINKISNVLANEQNSSEKAKIAMNEECEKLKKELKEIRSAHEGAMSRLKETSAMLAKVNREQADDSEEIVELKQQLHSLQENSRHNESRLEKELNEMKMILDEKTAVIHKLQIENESLTVDIAANQELSSMYERLQEQLSTARSECDDAEKRYSEMERRAEKAAKEREEDQRLLNEARKELEKLSKKSTHVSEQQEVVSLVKSKAESTDAELAQFPNASLSEELIKVDEPENSSTQNNQTDKNEQKTCSGNAFKLRDEFDKLSYDLEDVRKELCEKEQELNSLRQKDQEQKLRTSEIESQMKRMENVLATMEAEKEGLNEQISRMKEKPILREVACGTQPATNEQGSIRREEIMEKAAEIENLQSINEKLRGEFLQKEAVVSDLMEKIESLNASEKKKTTELKSLRERLEQSEVKVREIEEHLIDTRESNAHLKRQLADTQGSEELQKKLVELQTTLESKQDTEIRLSQEYETRLKEYSDRLEEAMKKISSLEEIRSNMANRESELLSAKQQAVASLTKKFEDKIAKVKKKSETDALAVKAELLLQLDNMRSQLAEKDMEIDDYKLNITSLEQRLADEGDNIRLVQDLREKIEEIAQERDLNAEEVSRITNESNSLRAELRQLTQLVDAKQTELTELETELEREKEKIGDLEACEVKITKLELELKEMKEESEKTKAGLARAEFDKINHQDLQKEIKQLYRQLNDKNQQIVEANTRIEELSSKLSEDRGTGDGGESSLELNTSSGKRRHSSNDYDDLQNMDYEEILSLRRQLIDCQNELSTLKLSPRNETAVAEMASGPSAKSSAKINNNIDESDGVISTSEAAVHPTAHYNYFSEDAGAVITFAEPTEAEYLRNVLYRYMSERESLGKESVTLARVIGTVVRFSEEQLHNVVAREEQRTLGWYGGTLSSVQELLSSTHPAR